MQEQKEQKEQPDTTKDHHPLITIGLITAGTQIGSALIQRMGRHPVLLFGMGIAVGMYTYKNRKEIISEAQHLKNRSIDLLSKKPNSE